MRVIFYGALLAALAVAGYVLYVQWPRPSQSSLAGGMTAFQELRRARAAQTPRTFHPPRPFVRPVLPSGPEQLELLARAGNADADCKLGTKYEHGDGVPTDYGRARGLFLDAATKHNGCAINGLGNLYLNGWGVQRDANAALSYYRTAQAAGYPAASYNLGRAYQYGFGVQPNDKTAFQYYKQAAEAGYQDAYDSVADYYENGAGGTVDLYLAEQYYLLAAQNGDEYAKEGLAYAYLNDELLPNRFTLALRWLRADAGSAWSRFEIGLLYENGLGVPKSNAQAARWYKLSADLGYMEGQDAYAAMLRAGAATGKPDPVDAARYFQAAARQGSAAAMYQLGTMAQSGVGMRRNPALGEQLYAAAAMHGNPDALLLLAYRYRDGTHGYPRDLERSEALAMVAFQHGANASQTAALVPARSTADAAHVLALSRQYEASIAFFTGDVRALTHMGPAPPIPGGGPVQ